MTQNVRSVSPPSADSVTSPLPTVALSPPRPRSLMESLLVAKMEQAGLGCLPNRSLVRTDSADSASSFGSIPSNASDICRCDDCLLGIVDLYAMGPAEEIKDRKRVCHKLERFLISFTKLFAMCVFLSIQIGTYYSFELN